VKKELQALRAEPYSMSTEQVVAIASNIGGKQALQEVKKELHTLRGQPYNLSTEQVVAVASNDGGKQALQEMKKQLPVLSRAPYYMSKGEVVNVARNIGGKHALKAVLVLLPILCAEPYRLRADQALNIAMKIGRKRAHQALMRGALGDVVVEQAPGGSQRASTKMPDGQHLVKVLKFLRSHPGMDVFKMAQDHFVISASEVRRFLALARITELEARSGEIPSFSEVWQRMRGRPGSSSEAAGGRGELPQDLQRFSASLEDLLGSPEPQPRGASPSRPRKRRAEWADAGEPSTSRAGYRDLQSDLASLLSAEPRRARSQRRRPTSGTPGEQPQLPATESEVGLFVPDDDIAAVLPHLPQAGDIGLDDLPDDWWGVMLDELLEAIPSPPELQYR
jgi:hypothetical protein